MLYGNEITTLPDPSPLIEDLLPLDATGILFGPSGGGKSLVALDWALHVASGMNWWGRKTHQGTVLYVVAEGARGTKSRYESWLEYHDVTAQPDIHWMTVPANILLPAERHALLQIVEELQPCMTILDTVARHIPGGDENSFETMSLLVETLDRIKRVTGGFAGGVHHTGKDEDKGSRGHSSLKGAIDAELLLRNHRDAERNLHVEIYAEKFKDWEDHRILYTAKMEKIGKSLVPVVDGQIPLTASQKQALASLNGHWTAWKAWCDVSGLPRSTFGRAQKQLLGVRLVETDGRGNWRAVRDSEQSQVSPI